MGCSGAKAVSFYRQVTSGWPAPLLPPSICPSTYSSRHKIWSTFWLAFAGAGLRVSYPRVKRESKAPDDPTTPHHLSLHFGRHTGEALLTRDGAGRSQEQGAGPEPIPGPQFSYLGWWAAHGTQDGDSSRKPSLGNRSVVS